MITLSPGSLCDVCAEEYGPHNYPHCIPCGHVLCRSCCNSILQKSAPKLTPSCPFCREHFTSDTVRLIRIDFSPSSSGWSTPKQCGVAVSAHGIVDDTGDDDDPLSASLHKRAEVKRLEQKVARVAAKKCSVEEVAALHRELQDWLSTQGRYSDKATSIHLSAALLRAILMNHNAHFEATKNAREIEGHLKGEIEELRATTDKLDTEIRSLRSQYSHTVQENHSLRSELSRYKTGNNSPVSPPRPSTTMPSISPTPSTTRATSPTSPSYKTPMLHSPLASRITSLASHARSASVAPPTVHSYRSATPSVRSKTPAVGMHRSESARPEKSRTLSISSPAVPKILRSSSNESSSDEIQSQKDKVAQYPIRPKHAQLWIPGPNASPPTGALSTAMRARTTSTMTPPRSTRTPAPR
ncbi:unnamed protein product [Somion occarium]|uniref:RING-type domain-containing protein n=1 Tax=Somion occarium TaxID=3059160 RepID=A0ABP1DTC8_9APHY